MKLIVGLGNPGEKFAGTRHNLGYEVIDKLAHSVQRTERSWKFDKNFNAEIIKTNYTINAEPCTLILVKPQTFMNLSGDAVLKIASYFKISSEDILIVHDELDLPLGKIKIRLGGAAAGHHGVEDIIEKLGTDKFGRLRLGIGNPKTREAEHNHISVDRFVVAKFNEHEVSDVKHLIKQGLKALEIYLDEGLEVAQRQFN